MVQAGGSPHSRKSLPPRTLFPIGRLARKGSVGFGGEGGWLAWIVILFAIFGWGNGGAWGNGCQNGVGAEVQRGFDTSAIIGKLDGINNGLCDGFYALNSTVQQGNFGLQTAMMQGFNAIQAQQADCCCTTQRSIDQVRFDMANNTCAVTNAVNTGFAQLDRTINDKFCELEMKNMQRQIDEQQSLINALNLAQSQANQTQTLVNTLRPCPTPTYLTCNPWATNGTSFNGCQGFGNGCCGC